MTGIRHRWVVISALAHAALLAGMGPVFSPGPPAAAVRPALNLTLLPALPGAHGTALDPGPKPAPTEASRGKTDREPAPVRVFPRAGEEAEKPVARAAERAVPEAKTGPLPMPRPETKPAGELPTVKDEGPFVLAGAVGTAGRDARTLVDAGPSPGSAPSSSGGPLGGAAAGEASSPAAPGGGAGNGPISARVVSLPEPVYPVRSRRAGEEGRVVIEVRVGPGGGLVGAEVIRSSSHPRLDKAALAAVRGAAFRPAADNGNPVESRVTVAYRFRLEER